MGKIIAKKVRGMNMWAKGTLIVTVTLLVSMFMYQGWYKPKPAQAAITSLQAWTNLYAGAAFPTTYTVAKPAGSNRMMVVAVTSNRSTVGTQTCTVSLGGQTFTSGINDEANATSRGHTWLFYLNDAGITASTNTTLTVTVSGGTTEYNRVYYAVYAGVDQSASPISNSRNFNSGATTSTAVGPFATGLNIASGEQAVEIVCITRTGSTTAYTITPWATGWASAVGPNSSTTTNAQSAYVAQSTTVGTTTSQHTATGLALTSMSAMSLKASVPDTTAPVVSAFTLPATSEGLTFPVSSFTGTDAVGVTGYMVTESSTAPLAGDAGWSGTAPATVTASGAGSKTFYPWVKDAAGNISATFGTPRTVTVTAISPLLHNSANLNSTKWAPAGWGVTGGKYGKFDCSTCHTASTSNLKRIKTPITLANMSTFNAAGTAIGVTSTVPVTFRNITSMGKDPSPTAYNASVRVCQACHSITAKHNSNNQRPMVTDHAHNNGSDCIQCHAHNTGFKGGGDCLGCHKTPQGATAGTARVAILGQFTASRNSHHVQGVAITPQACYACHWEAKSDGSMSTYHAGVPNGAVDLVITQAGGVRPSGTTYTEGTTGTAYTSNTTRNQTQLVKINNHCLGCHGANGFGSTPFANAGVTGETSNPEKYSWEKIKYGTAQSIAAKYSDTTTTLWGKFTGNFTNSKNSQSKAYSGHGNAANNARGWSTLEEAAQSTTTVNNYPNTSGAINVLCYDCHNSHGSVASAPVGAITTSYSSATGRGRGGILKNTVANKGGYTVAYRPYSGGNATQKNVYKAGAGICFDCHNNSAAGAATSAGNNSPWGYGTFGATQMLHGYNDNPYFGKTGGTFARGVTYPYIGTGLATNKGGHFGKSSNLATTPTGQIGGLCTPCHDPHGVSPGIASADRQYAVPMLKGTYVTSPYKMDAAAVNTAHGGGSKIASIAAAATAGYHIDQNTMQTATSGCPTTALRWDFATTASTLATLTDTQFAGLCMNCHSKASLQNTAPATTANWKTMTRVHNSVDGWATTGGGNAANAVHAYTCSKCHSAHNSNLPRLLVTDCLDARHKNRVAGTTPTNAIIGPFSGSNGSGNGLGRFPGGGSYAATGGNHSSLYGPWFFGTAGSAQTRTCHDTATAGGTTFDATGTSQLWNNKSTW